MLWGRRRWILGITAAGAVAGVIASFLMTPLYKSTATVFPAVSNSVSHSVLNEYGGGREDILGIGDEEDAEHLIQMLSAAPVRDRVIARFGLAEAYEVKDDDPHRLAHLIELYNEHVGATYTRYGSVEVMVLDEVPARAAAVANGILEIVDSVWMDMERERAVPGVALVEREMTEIQALVDRTKDSLRVLQRAGVNDYRTQAERFNAELAKAISRGDDRAVRALEARLAQSAEQASRYIALDHLLGKSTERLASMSTLRLRMQADLKNDLPRKLVVERAAITDKKVSPVRWLVALIATFSAFCAALVLVVVQDNLRRIRLQS
jgi:uncharacterized protein involved in exopolysaccharide biosynthesis